MSTDAKTIEWIADQARLGPRLAHRKMFGEYTLYVDGKVVALVCDDRLYLKPTPQGRALLEVPKEGAPYPGAKPHLLLDEAIDDAELLRRLLDATAAALPPPKAKPARSVKEATKKATTKAVTKAAKKAKPAKSAKKPKKS